MNKEVILKDGTASVIDHNGYERKVSTIDNLNEVLIQENIVEMIEKVIIALEDSRNTFKKNKLRDISYIPSPIISTISLPTILMYLNTGSFDGVINTKFGLMEKDKFLAFFIAVFIPIAYNMSKKWCKEYFEDAKCENGRLLALYHLKKNLVIQKERLNNLRNKSINITINEDTKYSLNEEAIENLQDHINLYYELGYNIKKYYEYFKNNGCLPEEVRNEYNDVGVKIMEDYLKNNGRKIKRMTNK